MEGTSKKASSSQKRHNKNRKKLYRKRKRFNQGKENEEPKPHKQFSPVSNSAGKNKANSSPKKGPEVHPKQQENGNFNSPIKSMWQQPQKMNELDCQVHQQELEGKRAEAKRRHTDWIAKLAEAHLSSIEDFWTVTQFSNYDQPLVGSEVLQRYNQYASQRLHMKEFLNLSALIGNVKTSVIHNLLHFTINDIEKSQETVEDVLDSVVEKVTANSADEHFLALQSHHNTSQGHCFHPVLGNNDLSSISEISAVETQRQLEGNDVLPVLDAGGGDRMIDDYPYLVTNTEDNLNPVRCSDEEESADTQQEQSEQQKQIDNSIHQGHSITEVKKAETKQLLQTLKPQHQQEQLEQGEKSALQQHEQKTQPQQQQIRELALDGQREVGTEEGMVHERDSKTSLEEEDIDFSVDMTENPQGDTSTDVHSTGQASYPMNGEKSQQHRGSRGKPSLCTQVLFRTVDVDWKKEKCQMLGLTLTNNVQNDFNIISRSTPLKIRKVRGDGNCFFRAISIVISGNEGNHLHLRKALRQHMNSHLGITYTSKAQLQQRIDSIKRPGSWATDVEIFFMAHLLQTDIHVFKRQYLNDWHTFGWNGKLDRKHNGDGRASILLTNTNNNHYDVVMSTEYSNGTIGEVCGNEQMLEPQRQGPSGWRVDKKEPPSTRMYNQGTKAEGDIDPRVEVRSSADGESTEDNVADDGSTSITGLDNITSSRRCHKVDQAYAEHLVKMYWDGSKLRRELNITWNQAYKEYCGHFIYIPFIDFRLTTEKMENELGLRIGKKSIRESTASGGTPDTSGITVKTDKGRLPRAQLKSGKEAVSSFVDQHYRLTFEDKERVSLGRMYQLYGGQKGNTKLNYSSFLGAILSNVQLKRRVRNHEATVNLKPITMESMEFHQWCPTKSQPVWKQVTQPSQSIQDFISSHFSSNGETVEIDTGVLYNFYQLFKQYRGETLDEFEAEITGSFKVSKVTSGGQEHTTVALNPISLSSKAHMERVNKEKETQTNSINFALANIQGLITNKRNKCKSVKEITNKGCKNQVIILTETWTKDNYREEILNHFKDYNLLMTDRIYDPKKNDPHQLKTRGGTLILTSPDITITPERSLSNGNCEIAIAKLPTINTYVVSMYRPSGKNFNLAKYEEALSWVRQYFNNNENAQRDSHIIFAGDFNFPKRIVEWKDSKRGVVANFTEGNDIQKIAFEKLLELTEDLQMEQIVNQPTRGRNILDLVFTSQPHTFSDCSTEVLKPLSDHRLVSFMFTNPTTVSEEAVNTDRRITEPEIATFNFRNADEEVLKKQLTEAGWKKILRRTPMMA